MIIYIKNLTDTDLNIGDISLVDHSLPASGQVEATLYNTVEEIFNSRSVKTQITDDKAVFIVDGREYTKAESLNFITEEGAPQFPTGSAHTILVFQGGPPSVQTIGRTEVDIPLNSPYTKYASPYVDYDGDIDPYKIKIKEAGMYDIVYTASFIMDNKSSERCISCWLSKNGNPNPSTIAFGLMRSESSSKHATVAHPGFLCTLAENDILTFHCVVIQGHAKATVKTIAGHPVLRLIKH